MSQPKRNRVTLGSRKAVQEIAVELMEDGTANIGVAVLVPVPQQDGTIGYKSVGATVGISNEERQAIIAALEGKPNDSGPGQGTEETNSPRKGEASVETPKGHSGGNGTRGAFSK